MDPFEPTPRTQREAGLPDDPLTEPLFGGVEWFLMGTGTGILIAIITLRYFA